MVYQHVNNSAKILPLATFRIAHLCKQFNQFALPISMPRFKSIIFYQYSPKIKLILKKNAKFSSAGGSAPRPPCLRWLGTLPPDPQNSPPQLRISGYVLPTLCTVYNRMEVRSFCFEQFFLYHSAENLMMFTTDVCLMLNCFLFEKFYLHYALCDFDSILLHYAKLFIRQSIPVDHEQIFDVTFETTPPPLKNPAYATVPDARSRPLPVLLPQQTK